MKSVKVLPYDSKTDPTEGIESDNFTPVLYNQGASRNLNDKKRLRVTELNNTSYAYYVKTPAYNLDNAQFPLFSGENNLINRIDRFRKEKVVVVEQSKAEFFNYVFTFSLFVLTIVLLVLASQYELELVPKSIINRDALTETQKKDLKWYNDVQLSSDIIKGLSVAYLITLGSIRIFKRTTV